MRPWQDHMKRSRAYEKAAQKTKHPQSRQAFLKNAKRFKSLALVGQAQAKQKPLKIP